METLLSILQSIGIIFIVIMFFNIMIFVHELGHFFAGKWRGAYIDRFQIWFGKPIWSKKIWGVQWGLGWIPAGGFVSLPQLEDMQNIEGKAELPAGLKPLKAKDKVIIAAAGPLFSLLLAYAFACIVWCVGKPVTELPNTQIGYLVDGAPAAQAGLQPGDIIRKIDGQPVTKWMGNMEGVTELIALSEHEKINITVDRPQADGSFVTLNFQTTYIQPETQWWQRSAMRKIGIYGAEESMVYSVVPNSPAALAGLQPGQTITHLNGQRIYSPVAILKASEKGQELELTVQSADAQSNTLRLTPALPDNWQGKQGATPMLGIAWGNPNKQVQFEYPNPQQQVSQSLRWMGTTLNKLIAPDSSVGMEHLSGPVGIGSYMYKMMELPASVGWRLLLWFAVVLNVNLAVLNILPLPVVDGGHVVLGICEMLRGKPVSGKFLDWIMTGFIFLLLFFFVFVTFKDIGDMVGKDEAEQLPEPIFNLPAQP
ncbi:MAG: RIP metalloprotease RseP [Akkermansia sp.]|nr:RIP metalloprotease RseP [Akkermansia sp.]